MVLSKNSDKAFKTFSTLFVIAAAWNLVGAFFGFFNTAYTFEQLFNQPLTDPLLFAIYQGAWGTTLTYFVGYLIVARQPLQHFGIVITGGIGKIGFIVTLLKLYSSGLAGEEIFVIVLGDALFIAFFIVYFIWLWSARSQPLNQNTVKS